MNCITDHSDVKRLSERDGVKKNILEGYGKFSKAFAKVRKFSEMFVKLSKIYCRLQNIFLKVLENLEECSQMIGNIAES